MEAGSSERGAVLQMGMCIAPQPIPADSHK